MTTPLDIYNAYPRHQGKLAALKAIEKALTIVDADTLLNAVREFDHAVKTTWDPVDRVRFVPMPATWFNQGRWDDDRRNWYRNRVASGLRTVN